jgi:hypothetical protein
MSDFTEINKKPESEGPDKTSFKSRWGVINPYVYTAILLFNIVLGFIGSTLINKSGGSGSAANPIIEIAWYIFPAYIIVDGILNKSFLWCPLRAAFPPLVQEFVMWLVIDKQYSSVLNLTGAFTEAFIYFLGSLLVVAIITRAFRISFKVRDLAIGFFGWFLVGSFVIWISNLLFHWEYLIPVVTVLVVGILLFMKRNWLVYGIVAGVITNILIFLLLFGLLFGGGLNWDTMSSSLLYGISSPFFMVGGYF